MRLDVKVDKYEVVQEDDGSVHVLRGGERWRECTGDKLVLALAHEVESLRERLGAAAVGDQPRPALDYARPRLQLYTGNRNGDLVPSGKFELAGISAHDIVVLGIWYKSALETGPAVAAIRCAQGRVPLGPMGLQAGMSAAYLVLTEIYDWHAQFSPYGGMSSSTHALHIREELRACSVSLAGDDALSPEACAPYEEVILETLKRRRLIPEHDQRQSNVWHGDPRRDAVSGWLKFLPPDAPQGSPG